MTSGDRLALTIRHEYAFWLGEVGRHHEAVAAYAAVADDRACVLGTDHPTTLVASHNLAYELGRVGRHDEAVTILVTVAEDRARFLGPEHPDTRLVVVHLVSTLVDLLRARKSLPPAEALGGFASTEQFRLLRDMEAARDGSAEAAARLPAELRSLMSGLPAGAS